MTRLERLKRRRAELAARLARVDQRMARLRHGRRPARRVSR